MRAQRSGSHLERKRSGGARLAAGGEGSDPQLVPTWVSVWVKQQTQK